MFKEQGINIIKKIIPSVVSIIVTKSLSEVEKEVPAEVLPLLPFGMPDNKNQSSGNMVQIDGGSGFIVDEAGIILTNKHVVDDESAEYTVIIDGGKKYRAEILAKDPANDIAILKIPARGLKAASLGDSSNLNLGQTVFAIGNALGMFQNTISKGIISGLSRSISAEDNSQKIASQELHGLIQTDAAINPGNSGGPLMDLKGKVVAINSAMAQNAHSINFAIPINAAKKDLADVKKFGKVRRPILGLLYINIDKNLKEKMNLPVDFGAFIIGKKDPTVNGVILGTPAAKAGFHEGDVITHCNDEKLLPCRTIQDLLDELSPGDKMNFKLLRNGKELNIEVILAEKK